MSIKAKNHLFYSLVLFLGISFSFTSCGDKTKISAEQASKNLIGKNQPEMVMALAAQDLLDKSGMADGSVFPAGFKMLFAEMVEYVTNSDKTGIDFGGRSFMMMNMTKEGALSHMTLVFNIKDPETFSKMIKEDLEVEPAEKDDYHYVLSPDNEFAIAWYKQFGMMVFISGEEGSGKDALEKKMGEMMTASIEESELPERYNEIFEDKADFAFLYSIDAFVKMGARESGGDNQEMMNKLDDIYEGSYSYYSLTCETDKIKGRIVNHLSDKAKNKFSSMFGKGVSPDMMNFLTNDQLFGFFTASVSAAPMFDFFKEMGGPDFDQEASQFEEETKLKISDLIGSFSGEMSMAFVGMEEKENSYSYVDDNGEEVVENYTSTQPIITGCFGLKNELIKSIMDTVKDVTKTENIYAIDNDFYMTFTGNRMFFSTSESIVKEVAANGKLKAYSANGLEKKAMEKPLFGYFDFKPLVASMGEREKEVQQLMANFDNVIAYGDMNEMTFEMNFRNTGENGLYVITKAVMDTYFSIEF